MDLVYLDNAATSYPKPKNVKKKIDFCLEKCTGNPGRSGHSLSLAAEDIIYDTREAIASHFNFSYPENIVFTYNATYAINLALQAKIPKECHLLISDIEHNSVIRPIERMRQTHKIEYSEFSTKGDIASSIKQKIRSNTKAIVSTIESNVTGKAIPLDILSNTAQKYGLILIVDASQGAGHKEIDLSKTPCDCFCAPAHKGLFGIQGAGFIIFSKGADIEPLILGGTGSYSKSLNMPPYLPDLMESGTPATPAIAALYGGLEFIEDMGVKEIEKKECYLSRIVRDCLSDNKKIQIYESFGNIILFNVKDLCESYVCDKLNNFGICVRGGLHCAPSAHKLLGTYNTGAVRVSLSYFTTLEEIDYFVKTVSKIVAEI